MDHKSSDDIKRAFAETGERIRSEAGAFAESVDAEKLRRAATDLADEAAELVRKYPLQSCLGALAAGLLLGAWLNRR